MYFTTTFEVTRLIFIGRDGVGRTPRHKTNLFTKNRGESR